MDPICHSIYVHGLCQLHTDLWCHVHACVPQQVRLQHMRSAMMIQRAACLDLIGEKAFNELYALLKSNQVRVVGN